MDETLPIDEAALSRSACRDWGWAVFGSSVIGCALTSCPLYWLGTDSGTGGFLCWLGGIFFVFPYLIAGFSFVQAVSAVPCFRLPGAWTTLPVWQRLVIAAFVLYAAGLLTLCLYFMLSLTPPVVQDNS